MYMSMMSTCVMFGKLIGIVLNTRSPMYVEMLLLDLIPSPIVPHSNHLASSLLNLVIRNLSSIFFQLDRRWRLWMAKVGENCAHRLYFTRLVEDHTELYLDNRRQDVAHDDGEDVDGTADGKLENIVVGAEGFVGAVLRKK